MYLPSSATATSLKHTFKSLGRLRKVKCFIQSRAITLVTYYKDSTAGQPYTYRGSAYIFTYTTWKGTTVALAHTSHLPPPDATTEEQTAEERDVEPAPSLPAFGCSLTY